MAEAIYGAVIELQVLNYIFQKNSFQIISLNGITEDYFTTYKDHFKFIRDFYNQYNQLPSKETFQGRFADKFEWLTVTDPEEYLIDKLNEAKLYRDLIVDYKKFAELIKDEKTDKAVEKMAEISQKYMRQKQGKCIDLIGDAKQRFDSYMERVNNPTTSFVTTGIKELDDIFGGWDLNNETAIIAARSGVGKCHEKGTLVLMADGTHKAVEDIKVGDKVQSINGVNTVFQTHNGVSSGYRIVPNNGNSFVVSSGHILSLWKDNKIVDITVEDYLQLPEFDRQSYYIIRVVAHGKFMVFLPFHIENVDRVEYYGFACDGDHRFLLADGTLSHNSWYMIKFALEAAKQGLRVGFYSGEMDADQVGYRLDTFLGNIANGSLTHGNSNVEEQYRNYIEEISKVVKGNIFIITPDMVGGDMTVSKLRAFVEKYDLQMLFVDQLSLIHDERNARSAWEQMSNISKDLRTLQRLKKIPIICAAQLNREEYDEGVNTKNIGGSDRVGQDATLVLFIERKGDNVILTIGKARNARTGDKLTYYWNTNMGILNYIPSEEDAKKNTDLNQEELSYSDKDRSNSVF